MSVNHNQSQFSLTMYKRLNNKSGQFPNISDSLEFSNQKYIDHFLGDFNGDGASDIILITEKSCEWVDQGFLLQEDYYQYTCINGLHLGIMDSISYKDCSGSASISLPFEYTRNVSDRFFLNDMNGDGFVDFIVLDDEGFIIYGNENGNLSNKSDLNISANNWDNIISDFTGDGIPDIASYSFSTFKVFQVKNNTVTLHDSLTILSFDHHVYTGDFNGDGIQDISYQRYLDQWHIKYGTGQGFTNDVLQFNSASYPGQDYYFDMILDFNGDGRDDLVGIIGTIIELQPDYKLYFKESIGNGSFESSIYSAVEYDFDYDTTKVADLNGDGYLDLIMLNENSIFYYNPESEHLLVKYIENGAGIRSTVNYNNLNAMAGTTYSQIGNYSFPLQSLSEPFTVVESFELSSTLHNDAKISESKFYYTDAVINKQGLGFLGFQCIETVTDSVHSTKTYNSFSFPDYYAFTDSVKTYYNNNLISTNIHEKNYISKPISGDTVFQLYSDKQIIIDHLDGNTTETDPTYDSNGNLTSTKTTLEDGSYSEVLFYDYLYEGSSFPQRVVKRHKHKDDTNNFSTETRIQYDTSNNRIEQVVENYGKSNETIKEFSIFNNFGIPTKTEITPDGLSTMTYTAEYDQTGRFMLSMEDEIGEKTFSYDTLSGLLLTEKDIYGNEVIHQYDNWGKKIITISPFGLSSKSTIDWANNEDPYNTLYTITEEDSLSTTSKSFIDYKGRSFKAEKEGFEGNKYLTETRFNQFNQVDSASNLYNSTGSPLWSTFSYRSSDGRITNKTLTGGATVSYSYSPNQVVQTINSNSYTTEFDASGNIVSVEDPLGMELDYNYFSSNGYKNITGNGGTLSFYYNDAGLDTTSVDPSLGTTNNSYNSIGQLTWIKDGNGNEYDLSYDTLYRLTRKENSNNASEYYTISYISSGNGLGQVYQKTYTNGSLTTTLTYAYDTKGRVQSETKQIGNKTYSITYTYDSVGRLSIATTSNGRIISYAYDDRGYMSKIYLNDNAIWELSEHTLQERSEKYG
ncbi:MAG TPA: FG-GAP-like repeat-containing protein, partial [Bacteroidales bacterium]|nr:FG-GAP-like repeat-containing protein [Bacteroidales bacterium]